MPLISLSGTPIHYEEQGQGGPTIVFVHGALCALDDWHAQMAYFAQRHRVVALDLPGHGQSGGGVERIGIASYAQAVIDLCAELGENRVVLVGHSMGCRVLLEAWRQRSALVAGLVLVDGAYLVPGLIGECTVQLRQQMAQQARERAGAPYVDVEPRVRAQHSFAQMFFDPRFDALRDAIVQRAMALPPQVARTLMPDFAAWDVTHMEPTLARIDVPMLVVACTYMNAQRQRISLAEHDTTPWLQAVSSLVSQARILRYNGAGHFPMFERPDDLHRDIDAFFAQAGIGSAG